jgi:hypothetical protein
VHHCDDHGKLPLMKVKYLHFEGVDKRQFVIGNTPSWVKTEWVVAGIGNSFPFVIDQIVATSKSVDCKRKKVVIDPADVDSKKPHHEEHVASNQYFLEDRIRFSDTILEEDEVEGKEK